MGRLRLDLPQAVEGKGVERMEASLAVEVPAELADRLIGLDEAEPATLVRGAGDEVLRIVLDGVGPGSQVVTIVTGIAALAKGLNSIVKKRRAEVPSNDAVTVVGPAGRRQIALDRLTPDELQRAVDEVRADQPDS